MRNTLQLEQARTDFDVIMDQAIREIRDRRATARPRISARLNQEAAGGDGSTWAPAGGGARDFMASARLEPESRVDDANSAEPGMESLDAVGDRLAALSRRLETSLKRSRSKTSVGPLAEPESR